MKTKSAKVNKSAAIRAILSETPNASAALVVERLKVAGITVVPNHVYGIQAELRKRKALVQRNGNGKPHRNGMLVSPFKSHPAVKKSRETKSGSVSDSVSLIRRAKELADDCGGLAELKELVDALA